MAEELRRASEIQNHLLPSEAPDIRGYSLCGTSIPCYEVGGDYFHYLSLGHTRYGIGLGDVAGKGLSAALLTFYLQSSVEAFSSRA